MEISKLESYLLVFKEIFSDNFFENEEKFVIKIKNEEIIIDKITKRWSLKGVKFDHQRIFSLELTENFSVIVLIAKLLQKGYKKQELYLEKSWKLGHNNSGYADVVVLKNGLPVYVFEVKDILQINNFVSCKFSNKTKQLFSYLWQDKNIKVASFYSFNFLSKTDLFFNFVTKDQKISANSIDELFENWNKNWDTTPFILKNQKFDFKTKPIQFEELKKIDYNASKLIFQQFLTILRQHSVSDKSNAFDKMINLLIAKVCDEIQENRNFSVNFQDFSGLKFQYIEGIDDDISFLKRINDLYRVGMNEYMRKQIIDYDDKTIDFYLDDESKNYSKIKEIFDNLRLKKNNAFSFIEVFDDQSFHQNNLILKQVVKLIQVYKFKYNNKHQFLGDFFEELLNTSLKQEQGQFFTPLPLVEFMVKSLPIQEKIEQNIINSKAEIVPKMIDYASGSGHFLISYMDYVQKYFNSLEIKGTKDIKSKLEAYKNYPFSWARDSVFGIEKDYRLAKTTKIATFLNGDGWATIVNGDGINKFSSDDYKGTILDTKSKKNEIFDFVIANPPYSVSGFLKNIGNNNIDESDFTLLKSLNQNSSEIEVLFVERMEHLLKSETGIGAIVLPRSILTSSKYEKLREFILKNFKIIALFESGDITFSGTTTSPIILFLQKMKTKSDYDFLVINSPKIIFQSNEKEKEFLGYQFSSNRNKLGIEIKHYNLAEKYSPLVREFFLNSKPKKLENYAFTVNISKILIKNWEKNITTIVPRYKKPGDDFIQLGKLIDEINPKNQIPESKKEKIHYLEISDLEKGLIKIKNEKIGKKIKKTQKIAVPGDLLISSLPNKDKIAISDDFFFVSPAIFVLKIKDEFIRKQLYEYIRKNKNNIISNMQVFLDGFKITYAKISEYNLLNNIFVEKHFFENTESTNN